MSFEQSRQFEKPSVEAVTPEEIEKIKDLERILLKKPDLDEARNELSKLYREHTNRIEKIYPEIVGEIKEVAEKVGFKEVFIDPCSLEGVAAVRPESFSSTVFWPKKSVEGIKTLKEFAPEFASKGLRLDTIHEKEHLKGPAWETLGAEEKFGVSKKWGNIEELKEGLLKIRLSREQQVHLQLISELRKYKNLFKEGKSPDIVEAVATEDIFNGFLLRGPVSLEKKVSERSYQYGLPFLKPEVIKKIAEEDGEIRKELLGKYQDWKKELK